MDILQSLTDAQRAAVTHIDGPLLVLAGPGSGKTRVVTHRIAHLLANGVDDRAILALTFTNKAADEMRRRVIELVPEADVWIGTFHRFCAQQLRKYADYVGLSSNFTILDSADSKAALKQAIKSVKLDVTHTPFDSLVHAISHTKSSLITASEYKPRSGSAVGAVLSKVYPAYQQLLLRSNAVDFDDLLLHVAVLLRESEELRSLLDARHRYIMVDEYQDTNLAQYAIVRALSIDHPNLSVTGDPDQSIYGWRGATIRNILEFEKDYPNVKVVRLEQNYRSTPRILQAADALISNNTRRLKKTLFTENEDGPPVRIVCYPSQSDEAKEIADRILNEVESGRRRFRDFAIFYRVNALSRTIEKTLQQYGIPFQMVNGVEFYQRKEIKDVLAYLRLINNPQDDIAFQRIINVPSRKIGKVTVNRVIEYAQSRGISLFEASRQAGDIQSLSKAAIKNLTKFVALIDRISEIAHGPVEATIGHVLSETGYRDQLVESENPEDEDRLANLEELVTDTQEFDLQHPGDGHLEEYLEERTLVNDADAWDEVADRVTMMTLHAAKGLEFPCVFIVAVEQGLLPHERSLDLPDGIEEERRLLFVGITRAERELQLSTVQFRSYRGVTKRSVPSSFLMELPRHEMDVVLPSDRFYSSNASLSDYDFHDESDDGGEDDFDQDEFEDDYSQVEPDDCGARPLTGIRTAAEVFQGTSRNNERTDSSRVDPGIFKIGMPIVHPDHGPGKIVALSGSGKNRTATINFAMGAGQKTIVLAHSPVRPIG